MSRTDKDRPWQLRICDTSGSLPVWFEHDSSRHARGECDAGSDERGGAVEHFRTHRSRPWYRQDCSWQASFWAFQPGPPHQYCVETWHGPERIRERVDLRNLAREYNAHGDLHDGDFPNWQHRQGASWHWW